MIAEYLDTIERALAHDRSLARRVRREIEDHLWEAVAASPEEGPIAAQRRAAASFGDPRAIAAQFAAISLVRRARSTGAVLILVAAGVFLTMKVRVVWYDAMQCVAGNDIGALNGHLLAVDRYAFWLAVVLGIASRLYLGNSGTWDALSPRYRRKLHRFILLAMVAAGALLVSVGSDAALTGLRLAGPGLSPALIVPLASIAVEVAGFALVVLHIRAAARGAASMRILSEA